MSCGDAADGANDGEKAEAVMPKRRTIKRVEKGICQRCREAKSLFIIRSATYCTACFELNVFSRFTRQLYPPLHPANISAKPSSRNLYRPPRLTSNVVVAVSGGAGSMSMLDMLARGGYVGTGEDKVADKTKGEKEVIWNKGWVVYVEFCGIIEGSEDRMEWIKGAVEGRGLDFVGLRAEDVFDPDLLDRLGGQASSIEPLGVNMKSPALSVSSQASSSSTPLEKLRTLVSSVPPPSRPALLSDILNSLLHTASAALPNVSHLLVGETATRQAQRIISGTASGRGWALPLELAGSLDLPNGVLRISPMKDLSLKEAAFSCNNHKIETRNHRQWGKAGAGGEGKRDARGKGGAMSIEGLTEQFIAQLNVTHPATVSTITRTGDKLVFPGGQVRDRLCPLCQMPVDHSAMEWKARTALTRLAKTPGSDRPIDPDRTEPTLAPMLCYACLTTLTPATGRHAPDVGQVELPLWVGEKVAVRRADMREEIKDFLLTDA